MSNFKVEVVRESAMNISGKNVFYCHETNCLYWCDVLGAQICKLDLNTNQLSMCRILNERTICFIIPIREMRDHFIVGAGRKLMMVNWDGNMTMATPIRVLCEIPVDGVRINQCRVDRQGRLFFGTMINEEQGNFLNYQRRIGSFYRFTMSQGLVELRDKVGLSNGIAWNSNWTKMYFVDSFDLNIYEFDYDLMTGNISNQKVLADLANYGNVGSVLAAGLTIDQNDNIYVAMLNGGKILKYDMKTRKIVAEIKLDIALVTSCEFGGKNFDSMFVTTSCSNIFTQQQYPAGFLLKITGFDCKGREMYKFQMK